MYSCSIILSGQETELGDSAKCRVPGPCHRLAIFDSCVREERLDHCHGTKILFVDVTRGNNYDHVARVLMSLSYRKLARSVWGSDAHITWTGGFPPAEKVGST